jgi:hypothetical protein
MAFASGILTLQENSYLANMTNSNLQAFLLYKATRDGFEASSFHSKCDGRANTVTIIKTNNNYVFGGYTSAAWSSSTGYAGDSLAFIFSLRRNGVSYNDKFRVINPSFTIFFRSNTGPIFGAGYDIFVANNSNVVTGSLSNFGFSFALPPGYTYGSSGAQSFLAGSYDGWLTTEIEVHQKLFFVSEILTSTENAYLSGMTSYNAQAFLLYKATRDGFRASSFHSKCDGRFNTVTIIKTNNNYVFGGYTSAAWSSSAGWVSDTAAFIFSLRRNGVSYSDKFGVIDSSYAMVSDSNYGPVFGGGYDIFVADNSNVVTGSNSNFGYGYSLPSGYIKGSSSAQSFLAGSYNGWLTTEIEVFQL